MKEMFKPLKQNPKKEVISEISHKYFNADGTLFGEIKRVEFDDGTKTFYPNYSNTGKGFPKDSPLYNLMSLESSNQVLILEGEKSVDAAQVIMSEYALVTTHGGSNGYNKTDFSPLKGKDCIIWPDADKPGIKYANAIYETIKNIAATVKVIKPPKNKKPGWDLADAIEEGWDRKKIYDYMCEERNQKQLEKLTSFTAAELLKHKFTKVEYVLPNIITEGLTILAGKPKIGKSWFCLDLAWSVAKGEKIFNDIMCAKGGVLYLALEDNPRRLKDRIEKIRPSCRESIAQSETGETWPANLYFKIESPSADDGGIELIESWIDEADNPKLVIIDTLARFCPSDGSSKNQYKSDYSDVAALQSLATDNNLAIVLVHHIRKMTADDPFDKVSGTLGISGAADATIVIDRGSSGTTLYGRGRDIEEFEKVMSFDKQACRWSIVGEAKEIMKTEARQDVVGLLTLDTPPMKPKDIAKHLGKKADTTRQLLTRMHKDGKILKADYGSYAHIDYKAPCHSSHGVTNNEEKVTE